MIACTAKILGETVSRKELKKRARLIPVICPKIVAIAAPLTPSAGKPKSPKMRIGSMIIFIIRRHRQKG